MVSPWLSQRTCKHGPFPNSTTTQPQATAKTQKAAEKWWNKAQSSTSRRSNNQTFTSKQTVGQCAQQMAASEQRKKKKEKKKKKGQITRYKFTRFHQNARDKATVFYSSWSHKHQRIAVKICQPADTLQKNTSSVTPTGLILFLAQIRIGACTSNIGQMTTCGTTPSSFPQRVVHINSSKKTHKKKKTRTPKKKKKAESYIT